MNSRQPVMKMFKRKQRSEERRIRRLLTLLMLLPLILLLFCTRTLEVPFVCFWLCFHGDGCLLLRTKLFCCCGTPGHG